MDTIREYLISVTAAALICAIVKLLVGEKGTVSAMLKLISGLFLCITVISPLIRLEIADITEFAQEFRLNASDAVLEGEDAAQAAMASIIKTQAEAYILDKAASMEVEITVDITLSNADPPVPCGARIVGAVSPYARRSLSTILEQELGVEREAQIWIT